MALRITKKEANELARLQKNARAKQRRLEKRGVDRRFIPPIPNYKTVKSRETLNRWKEEARDFTNRANRDYRFFETERGLLLPESARRELREAQREANANYERRVEAIKDLPYIVGSETAEQLAQQNRTVGQDRIGEPVLEYRRNLDSFRSITEYERYLDTLAKVSGDNYFLDRDTQWVDNYRESLLTTFGDDGDSIIAMWDNFNFDTQVALLTQVHEIKVTYNYSRAKYQAKLNLIDKIFKEVSNNGGRLGR